MKAKRPSERRESGARWPCCKRRPAYRSSKARLHRREIMRKSKTLALIAVGCLLAVPPIACKKKSATKETEAGSRASGKKVLYWYDPMKPQAHFDKPGKSPFMDMQLEPKYAEEAPAAGTGAPPPGFSVVKIPLERRQEIGVTTAKVEKRTISGAIETNGVVAEDEGRLNAVNAKFAGYIEKLYVDRTGQPVRRSQPLLTVYSPDLVATERELLLALENTRRLSSGSPQAVSDASTLLSATRQRLRFWDIPDSEITRIERSEEHTSELQSREN